MTDVVMMPRPAGRTGRRTGVLLVSAVPVFALIGPLAVRGNPYAQSPLKALSGPQRWAAGLTGA